MLSVSSNTKFLPSTTMSSKHLKSVQFWVILQIKPTFTLKSTENIIGLYVGYFLISSKGSFICTIPQASRSSTQLSYTGVKCICMKEGNVLFNDALNTLYFKVLWYRTYGERGNLPQHGLLFPINSKGSF